MKILQVNKYLYPKGGSETYMFEITKLLQEHGHKVKLWGTEEKIKERDERDDRDDREIERNRGRENREIENGDRDRYRYRDRYRDIIEPLVGEYYFGSNAKHQTIIPSPSQGEESLSTVCHSEPCRKGEESLSTPTTDRDPSVVAKLFRDDKKLFSNIKNSLHLIWSLEAKHKFAKVLDKFKPDIIHIHNIYHHLTPSILSVAKKRNIPIVMTVHDYNLINHNYLLFDHGQICEREGWQSFKHKCIGNSYLKTFISLTKFFVQQKTQAYQKNVDLFICPTEFVSNKLIAGGFDKNKIVTLGLPVDIKHGTYNMEQNKKQSPLKKPVLNSVQERVSRLRSRAGMCQSPQTTNTSLPPLLGGMTNTTPYSSPSTPYILFAGRLSTEKGIDLLLKIAKLLPDINFVIAGDGPLRSVVASKAKESPSNIHHSEPHRKDEESLRHSVLTRNEAISAKIPAPAKNHKKTKNNITYIGLLNQDQLFKIIQKCRLIIIPSLWYETANLVLLESMRLGKPVIATKIGGMQNIITNKKNGFLLPIISSNNRISKSKEVYQSQSPLKKPVLNLVQEGVSRLRSRAGVCQSPQTTNTPLTPLIRGEQNNINLDQTAILWAKKIQEIFNNKKLLNKIGQEAEKTIKTKNNPEKYYKKLVKIYEAVSRVSGKQ